MQLNRTTPKPVFNILHTSPDNRSKVQTAPYSAQDPHQRDVETLL